MPDGSMPNFVIIGTAKAGTTALYTYLKQHPQIFMSAVKEPHFFAYEGDDLDFNGPGDRQIMHHMVTTHLADYQALFAGRSDRAVAVGEASAMYLYIEGTAARLQRYLPEVKIVAILRNPVERAYSSFLHLVRDGREELPFDAALEAEAERIRQRWIPLWHYRAMGHYSAQLERYLACFATSQIQIHLYEDLRSRPQEVLSQIFSFLGVDADFVPNTSLKRNVSGTPRIAMLQRILSRPNPIKDHLKPLFSHDARERLIAWVKNWNTAAAEALDPAIRDELSDYYRPEIDRLERLLGRDLADWR